ncbi:MAG: hypothetical protein ACI31M_00875 [Bacilli bacterium]
MNIGIDIDDTMFDTNEMLIEKALYYDKIFLKNKGFKDKDKFMFEEMFYWNKDNCRDFLRWVSDNGYLFQIKIKKDVERVISSWKKLGINIIIITFRKNSDCEGMYEKTAKMLLDNGIMFDKLIVDSGPKGDVCLQENIDIFIDDSYRHCLDARSKGINHVIMFESRYNKNYNFFKLNNWQDLDIYVRRVYDERKIS